jgi:YD repeat-containing protein
MAGPISFDPFLGWVDATDPNNIPDDARVIGAGDLLRYENLGKAVADYTADQESAFPASQTIAYNPDGSIASVTTDGITTAYTYNPDGTVATDTRNGVTRTYTYDTNFNLTGIEAI